MRRIEIEDMPVKITYSDKKIDKKGLYRIFYNILDRAITNENQEMEDMKIELDEIEIE